MKVRRAKIVCTIGPAVDEGDRIQGLVHAGMDVARLNFSHGTADEHRERAARIRAASRSRPVALLQDLCGPKIRSGKVGPERVEVDQIVRLIAGDTGDDATIAVSYEGLVDDVQLGDPILLGDGHVELKVTGKSSSAVEAVVEHGGALRARMGVNLPSRRVRLKAITDKDRQDLEVGLELGVDYVALSFVRSAADIHELRALCEARGRPTPIVAKVETPSAVEHIEEIVAAADAIMVARGDLGVELPPERVPVVQRRLLEACRAAKKPSIVATEMLASMVHAPRPTRAEASDVATAVFGGADAVMLSAETASGQHPLASCRMMDRIIREAEASSFFGPVASDSDATRPDAIAHAACRVAEEIGAKVIVTLTQSGGTARLVSKARPRVPVLGLSPDESTLRRLALYWGVSPRSLEVATDIDQLNARLSGFLKDGGWAESGDSYVLVYGAPLGMRGSTNSVRAEVVE